MKWSDCSRRRSCHYPHCTLAHTQAGRTKPPDSQALPSSPMCQCTASLPGLPFPNLSCCCINSLTRAGSPGFNSNRFCRRKERLSLPSQHGHGGLNENGPHRLRSLNTWPPVGGAIWGRIRTVTLLKGESLGVAFGGQNDSGHSCAFR